MRQVQIVSRWRPVLGQTTMSMDERNEILAKIKLYREMMNEINQFTQTAPEWAKVDPFGKSQPQFDKALDKAYNASDKVREIESYLNGDGPWLKLDDATNAAFSAWQSGIDEMYSLYKAAKPDLSADARAVGAVGFVGILFTAVIMA